MTTHAGSTNIELAISLGSDPRRDVALDDADLAMAADGRAVLRVYSWDSPTVILGYNQSMGDVDLEYCGAHEVPLVRRQSGGRGVIHHRDLGVSLALPMSHPWASGIRALYRSFGASIADGLRAQGHAVTPLHLATAEIDSPVCFEQHGIDGLYLGGRRVFGSAQIRRQRAVLIHGTLLLGLDPELYGRVFRVPASRISARLTSLGAAARRAEIAGALTHALWDHVSDHDTHVIEQPQRHPPAVAEARG